MCFEKFPKYSLIFRQAPVWNDDDFESGPISHYKKFPGREKVFSSVWSSFSKVPLYYTVHKLAKSFEKLHLFD